jgi:hypothetical protein
MECRKHVRWHDKFIVVDLSISDFLPFLGGPEFPRFMLSLRNTTKCLTHWNNQPDRLLGMEQWG